MSYGKKPIRAGDGLHFVGFPDLVRVSGTLLQVQLPQGWLVVEGRGMALLHRELLAGQLEDIQVGPMGAGIAVDRIEVNPRLTPADSSPLAGECCTVPTDLILVETTTSKDYLARSALGFFGRFGQQQRSFLLGFADRSYRLEASPGRSDLVAEAIFAARFAPGTTNTFTTVGDRFFLPGMEIHRHRLAKIEEVAHRPDDWLSGDFTMTLFFAKRPAVAGKLPQHTPSRGSESDLPEI